MDKIIIEATNTHTTACFLINRIENENQQLEDILNQLENGEREPMLYCPLKQIFMDNHCEILNLSESVDSILMNPELDMDLAEALEAIRMELLALKSTTSELEEKFTPYLFCPALEEPEKIN